MMDQQSGQIETHSVSSHDDDIKRIGIRLCPYDEVMTLSHIFADMSGLTRHQFAINSWGYPFIPIPDVRDAYGRVRLAPKNVNNTFLGHPIYWIDPALTLRLDDESEEQWCIRMFYVIDALGYWDENVQWVNYFDAHEIHLNDADVKAYHLSANPEILKIDEHSFLSEQDFENEYTLADVDRFYTNAIATCAAILERESVNSIMLQTRYYALAQKIIGESLYDPTGDFNDSHSIWRKKFMPAINTLVQQYARVENGDGSAPVDVPHIHKDMIALVNNILSFMRAMNKAYAILKVSIDSRRLNYVNASMMSVMLDQLGTLSSANDLVGESYTVIVSNMSDVFADEPSVKKLAVVIRDLQREYKRAWQRVRLWLINYDRMSQGQEPFASYTQLTSYLMSQQTISDRESLEREKSRVEDALKRLDQNM